MKIKWLGYASFLITSAEGTSVLTDPYNVGRSILYTSITVSADAITVSNNHSDHNNNKAIRENPQVIREEGIWRVKNIEIKGISSFEELPSSFPREDFLSPFISSTSTRGKGPIRSARWLFEAQHSSGFY